MREGNCRALASHSAVFGSPEDATAAALDYLDLLCGAGLVDELTGLPSRRLFRIITEQVLERSKRERTAVALFRVKIAVVAGAKPISEEHAEGIRTEAIQVAGRLLEMSIREGFVTSRLCGGDFAIFAADADESTCDRIENEIRRHVRDWHEYAQTSYRLSVRVGRVLRNAADDEANYADLQRAARVALCAAEELPAREV